MIHVTKAVYICIVIDKADHKVCLDSHMCNVMWSCLLLVKPYGTMTVTIDLVSACASLHTHMHLATIARQCASMHE